MAKKLTLRFDRVGDILYVDTCLPYAEQESEELSDGIIGRYNPESGELETLEILSFTKRFPRGGRASRERGLELPFTARGAKADPPFAHARRPARPATVRSRRR